MNQDYIMKIQSADAAVSEKGAAIRESSHRLGYHISAPSNWINDPNGLIHFKGEYHVFYQHHPFGEDWGPMYWGHVKSKDLVHWEQLPIALAPFEEYDRDGCFSGSAVVEDGLLTLIYTGNVWLDDQQKELKQVQCIARSEDGISFIKDTQNPVLESVPEDGSSHFRDPKVWKEGSFWYMVLGTQKDGLGKVVLYRSEKLTDWEYCGVLAENRNENLGYMWECPDIFELGGKHVLLISPEGMEQEGPLYANLKQTGYFVGDFSYETLKFDYGRFEELDKGHDFYAAQTFLDDTGRRILIAWMDMWEQDMPSKHDGWAGALTIPRVLSLSEEGRVLMNPVAELESLRGEKKVSMQEITVEEECTIGFADMAEIIVEFTVEDPALQAFGLKLRCGAEEETVVTVDLTSSKLFLNREKSGRGPGGGIREADLSRTDRVKLHIFLDQSSAEIFANRGEAVMTSRIYPERTSTAIKLFSIGGKVCAHSVNVWKLNEGYIQR
ncbi:glycoside hydrolase family 32 protein [Metabacillus sp. FJAT-52054]|uniref:Sucrose-6-phosphate hydrolase n=1 Tax=Metabacillus sediminis TaxID=3117746 RepID=A0ABZ2NMR3_9BACI